MPNITSRQLQSVVVKSTSYFIRDSKVTGFAVKVNPTGAISLLVEVKHQGKSTRKTLGRYPLLSVGEARAKAVEFIQGIKSGKNEEQIKEVPLRQLFRRYLRARSLKPSTVKSYKETINFYLSDWLSKSVSSISRSMVEGRFYRIRDKGIRGGIPTYSQATKTMRVLSTLMNYAMADGLIESNPVDVLRLKKINRSMRKRDNYLPAEKVKELLQKVSLETHPVTLAIRLMLFTGLRKNEALTLKWSDIEEVEGIPCIITRDTKNHRPHYLPITSEIQKILSRASNSTKYVFPSPLKKGSPMSDERPTVKRLSKLIDYPFKCHDLRRTFATRATEVGIDYLMVKRLLNHKSNDITAQYIQWHSKENLLVARDALSLVVY